MTLIMYTLRAETMNFVLKPMTKTGSVARGVRILRGLAAAFGVVVSLIGCAGFSADSASTNSELVTAANAEIAASQAAGEKDTQCSDFVAKVLRRTGLNVPAFHANDLDQIMKKYLPTWGMHEFTTDDLAAGRADLRTFLNSVPDHTAFLAQWPRINQSGHVAIVEKVSTDHFMIYQAQASLSLPHSQDTKVESLLYGTPGVDRSRLRLYTE